MAQYFRRGQVIKFDYYPIGLGADGGQKTVLVIHGDWEGKVHGIDLGKLSDQEKNILRIVMNPESYNEDKYIKQSEVEGSSVNALTGELEGEVDVTKLTNLPAIAVDILRQMKPGKLVQENPKMFYHRFIKRFLGIGNPGGKDAYRTYYRGRMRGTVIMKRWDWVKDRQIVKKPLFPHEQPEAPTEPITPFTDKVKLSQDKLAALKQKAAMQKAQPPSAPGIKPMAPGAMERVGAGVKSGAMAAKPAQPAKPSQPAKPAVSPQQAQRAQQAKSSLEALRNRMKGGKK